MSARRDIRRPRRTAPRSFEPAATVDAYPLALHGVSKRWPGESSPVLDGIDLTLLPGTVTWIFGRNGAGKTTFLRIAAGLIRPDTGVVRAWGNDPRHQRQRYQQLVSFMAAGDRGLYARLSVRRQLELWARLAMLPKRDLQRCVREALDRFGLRELESRRMDRLSMGQRQRVRIAMTFLPSPEVALLDEPHTSLDEDGLHVLNEAVEDLRARGGAVAWCSPATVQPTARYDARWGIERGQLRLDD